MPTHLILVPGFLGFQRLGTMSYFVKVEGVLTTLGERLREDVEVHAMRTLPTGTLGARAAKLAEFVAGLPDDGGDVHLLGHSTGGLDARLFLSPGASLPTTVDVGAAASRVRSVVSIAAPHHGTPLALFMTGVNGHRLLRVMSFVLTKMLSTARGPARAIGSISEAVLLLDALSGLDRHVRKPLADRLGPLLSKPVDADLDDGGALHPLIEDMGHDSALLEHLTPSSMDLFNTAVGNRHGVAYGCIVAAAPPPSVSGRLRVGLDPVGQLGYALFSALHRLCALSNPRRHKILDAAQRTALNDGLGRMPETADSDAFVPTLSQVWGQVIDARPCDHLDLMGYYGEHGTDLLPCAADFGAAEFERVWQRAGLFALDPGFRTQA